LLEKNIRYLQGVGPARAAQLARLGVGTVGDLLLHVPRTWFDRREAVAIASLEPGTEATVTGEIVHTAERPVRGGRRLFQAVLSDGSGCLTLTFFRPAYVRSRLAPGRRLSATGRVELYGGLCMTHPEMVFHDDEGGGAGGVLPVYPLTAGITQGVMRNLIARALDESAGAVPDILPRSVLESEGWPGRHAVFASVHRPSSPEEGRRARKMLALEELYLYQLVLRRVRRLAGETPGKVLEFDRIQVLEGFTAALPFDLTAAQERVTGEILDGLSAPCASRRLLQGDVGCGKTVVAAVACHACCSSGSQAVVLAPTEVLAAQHWRTLSGLLSRLGHRCMMLTGGTSGSERSRIIASLSAGGPAVLVGTHAVLESDVQLPSLGLLVVDEQHKFGVTQREALLADRIPRPHLLVMSATPIPRTLAMTFYGDLELSVIDEMPPGRGRVSTDVVTGEGRVRVFEFLRSRLREGERAYIVYPLREATGTADLLDARTAWETLSGGPLGAYGAGLLYGTMRPSEKLEVTDRFASGEISILVSTTVVEVGLDVPEATVMIVANAERFGLSQLHQLRGRIGRGGRDAWCFLMAGDEADGRAMDRLETMESTTDGFVIAEKDLQMRGPGQVLGTRQHGMPEFRVADLAEDADLVGTAAGLAAAAPEDAIPDAEVLWRYRDLVLPGA
jgi:ATP-dependent DNA helicase RecG